MMRTFLILAVAFAWHFAPAQLPAEPWLKGFKTYVAGPTIGYQNAMHVWGQAMLVRSQDEKRYIEWQTQALPSDADTKSHCFAWLAGYDSVPVPRQFRMFINGTLYFTFTNNPVPRWRLSSPSGAVLQYHNLILDQNNDFQGYHFLTVPAGLFTPGKPLTIRVAGESRRENTWYMAFMDTLQNSVSVINEQALVKTPDGLQQQVRVEIVHHGLPGTAVISLEGQPGRKQNIVPGKNILHYTFDQETSKKEIKLNISMDGNPSVSRRVMVKPVRKFDIYLLPHSHVDIGYTNVQPEVAKKQGHNLEEAIDLAKKTANYPEEARFRWNAEVYWPVDVFLHHADEGQKQKLLSAIQAGIIGIDGLYGNQLTGLMRPEELIRMAGENVLTAQQKYNIRPVSAMISDVPGYTWGLVTALAQNGIRYFSSGPNYMGSLPHQGDRVGYTLEAWGDKPFYWEDPSGKNRILFWMSAHGYSWFHGGNIGDVQKSAASPILSYLDQLDDEGYPFDMLYLRYTTGGDNGPPDPGLPDFVKNWNEKHAWPKFHIATTASVFQQFEKRYGDQLPVLRGDFTPYWEDGAASSARETAINRNAADKLVQAEVAWSIFKDSRSFPYDEFYEAWKNVILFSEHTWGADISISQPDAAFTHQVWSIKQKMALDADSLADDLLSAPFGATLSNQKNVAAMSSFTVINTCSWKRSQLLVLPAKWTKSGTGIVDETGHQVAMQRTSGGGWTFVAKDVPAMGTMHYTISNMKKKHHPNKKSKPNELSNGLVTLRVNAETGAISYFGADSDGINRVDTNAPYQFNQYVYSGINATDVQTSHSPDITITQNGPVVYEMQINYMAPGARSLQTTLQLVHGFETLFITNLLDKADVREKENVRFAFPFRVDCGNVTMDLAWGKMHPGADQLNGANKNYYTIQRWVDVSSDKYGVTWYSPDAPLVELGDLNGEAWMSDPGRPWIKKYQPTQTLYSWVMNNSWHTNYKASQSGKVTFRYVIDLHEGPFDAVRSKKQGISTGQPLLLMPGKVKSDQLPVTPQASPVIVTSLRPAEDVQGYVLRLFNTSDDYQTLLSERWFHGNKTVFLSNARHDKISPLGKSIYFGPQEVKTLLLME